MFHEVGPDEQNARGPREAVNDLGTKSLLSSEERSCRSHRPHGSGKITVIFSAALKVISSYK